MLAKKAWKSASSPAKSLASSNRYNRTLFVIWCVVSFTRWLSRCSLRLWRTSRFVEVAGTEVEPHHGMGHGPVPPVVDVEALEQCLVALEQLLESIEEQALAETPGTGEEVVGTPRSSSRSSCARSAYSGANRSLIPAQTDHPFRWNPTTDSGAIRSVIPVGSRSLIGVGTGMVRGVRASERNDAGQPTDRGTLSGFAGGSDGGEQEVVHLTDSTIHGLSR